MATEIYDAKITFISLVGNPANLRSFLITKATNGTAEFTKYGRIIKSDNDLHHITGIAYEPDVEDAQGEFMSADEVEKAAHWFMKNVGQIDMSHSFKALDGAAIVESWVAPEDSEIGGTDVKKGTWLVKAEISDDAIWKKVCNGTITGFSIGGKGCYKQAQHYLHDLLF